MKPTIPCLKPVVTLLSPSAEASRNAQQLLKGLVGLEPQNVDSIGRSIDINVGSNQEAMHHLQDDKLNRLFNSRIPGMSFSWHSSVSKCPSSGAIFHFLSLDHDSNWSRSVARQPTASSPSVSASQSALVPFSLLSLTDSNGNDEHPLPSVATTDEKNQAELSATTSAVVRSRNMLSECLARRTWLVSNLKMKNLLSKQPMQTADLLSNHSTGGMPLIELPTVNENTTQMSPTNQETTRSSGLKEIVIPYHDYATYKADDTNILSTLSARKLPRPCAGVYKWDDDPSSPHIRPLPSASVDRSLGDPSFVFQQSNLDEAAKTSDALGIQSSRIGFGGLGSGQLMMMHKDFYGLDVRVCAKTEVCSAFHEAQESLLAASIDNLQSTNAMLDGTTAGNQDNRTNDGDCWVEVRETVRRPQGFFDKVMLERASFSSKLHSSKPRIAKVPDIPYE